MLTSVGQTCIDISMGHDKPRLVTVQRYVFNSLRAGARDPMVSTEDGREFVAIPQNLRPNYCRVAWRPQHAKGAVSY